MQILKPNSSHLTELLALWEGQYSYHNGLDDTYYVSNSPLLTERFEKHLLKAINNDDPHILVALEDNSLLGFITFNEGEADYFDTKITHYGEIIELFVLDDHRMQGVGKALMSAAENYFKEKGITTIKLQSSSFNETALKFYDKLNYKNRQSLLFKQI
jgi:diamine N-acetyltransferase